jgi:tRNA modification GTPase
LASSTIEVEADQTLARCTTRRTASILLTQREGALRREVDAIREDLTSARHESAAKRLAVLLARAPLGLHLAEPWRVAIAGQPNVGKSSHMNALVGYQRAIVFDQPGTTRDVLTAETAIDGWPVRLADAAGIRDTDDALEAEGVLRARRQLAQADLTLWLLDGSQLAGDPLEAMNRQWREATEQPVYSSQVLTVVNKADLLPAGASDMAAEGVQFVSALTGAGLTEFVAAIGRILVPVAPQDDAIPFTSRQVELLSAAHVSITVGHLNEAADGLSRL